MQEAVDSWNKLREVITSVCSLNINDHACPSLWYSNLPVYVKLIIANLLLVFMCDDHAWLSANSPTCALVCLFEKLNHENGFHSPVYIGYCFMDRLRHLKEKCSLTLLDVVSLWCSVYSGWSYFMVRCLLCTQSPIAAAGNISTWCHAVYVWPFIYASKKSTSPNIRAGTGHPPHGLFLVRFVSQSALKKLNWLRFQDLSF